MDQSVQDAVSNGGIAYLLVPVRHGKLASQHSGATLVAFFTNLQEVAPLHFTQRVHGPIIDHQHIGVGNQLKPAD